MEWPYRGYYKNPQEFEPIIDRGGFGFHTLGAASEETATRQTAQIRRGDALFV